MSYLAVATKFTIPIIVGYVVLGYLLRYELWNKTHEDKYLTTEQGQLEITNFNKSLFGVEVDGINKRLHRKESPFTFMKEYRNPCWVEHLAESYLSEYKSTPYSSSAKEQISLLSRVYDKRLKEDQYPWRVRCLPYLYLIGVTKCGTTDLYYGILKHPDVHGPWIKEPMYWNRGRYPRGVVVHKDKQIPHVTFAKYLNMYDHTADIINQTGSGHQHIIVDGSSYLFWEDNGWTSHPDNHGLKEPKYTTPMALYAAQPQAKLVVLLRHPTDRLYSAYTMYNNNPTRTPQHFDLLVRQAIAQYDECFKAHNTRACVYNVSLAKETFPITLRASMYVVYLQDWLAIFPRDQLLIIKSEDYYKDRISTFRDVFSFLSIRGFGNETATNVAHQKPKFKRAYQAMLQSTRESLDTFFRPFNILLEETLNRSFWN